jgi:CDP-diacylglycerol--serine O-phosphatidyltransferase
MKQIPNIFTLLNLIFGCLAIISILQNGLTITSDVNGSSLVILPEKIFLASVFIGCAGVIDFLDGFVARLLKASSEIGKQLDSLADVVSFGVAPGLIVYQFLRLSYAQQEEGLDISLWWLLPAFLIPCAGAYRLARFNIDTEQRDGFRGLPIPAAGLLIASFPLIYWHSSDVWLIQLMLNKWFWYIFIIIISWLMISTLPMMALKFKDFSIKNNLLKYCLLLVSAALAVVLQWLAVPIIFVVYVTVSLTFKSKQHGV